MNIMAAGHSSRSARIQTKPHVSPATAPGNPEEQRNQTMKHQTLTNLTIRSSLALALALTLWAPIQGKSAEPATWKTMMKAKMMESCEKMKEQKEKLKADSKIQNAELTAQVAKMNSTPDNKKSGVIAALVTRMVEQRIAMDARKAKMEDEMMEHMMQHMQMGKESMMECPMMKGMKGNDEKPTGDHKEHHAEQK
jgi:hypothetical protein